MKARASLIWMLLLLARPRPEGGKTTKQNKPNERQSQSRSQEKKKREWNVEQNRTEQKVDLLLSTDDIYKHDVTQLTIKNDSK